MMGPLKVAVGIPVLLVGGTEIQTLHLVRVLVDAGYQVVLCCYYEHDVSMVRAMEKAGADVLVMNLARADGLWHLLRKLIGLFRKIRPSVVHVQYVAPGFVPIVAARLAGVKKVLATVHQPGRTHGWKARLILRAAAKFCDLFFCVSRSAEESWFGDSALFNPELYKKGRRHFTLYNAVDVERIAQEARSEHVDRLRASLNLEGKKVVGYVGRLRWEKGPHVLIEAFAKVVREVPNAVLLMVGDGPDRIALEHQAKQLGMSNQIIWLGQKPQKDVFRLYGLMDVVAMPSFFEGFGLTAAEAMAAGVPVVASDVDGLSEVIENNYTGLLVPVGDSNILAKKLEYMLVNSSSNFLKGLKINTREHVKLLFSFQQFSKNYNKIDKALRNDKK